MEPWIPVIVAVVSGAISSYIIQHFQKPKTKAEAAKLIVDASGDLIEDMQTEMKRLKKKIDYLDRQNKAQAKRIKALESGFIALTKQICDLDHTPVITLQDLQDANQE